MLLNDSVSSNSNDPSAAADAGNGYLMRNGYTVVWSSWQGDVPPGEMRMRLEVPVLKEEGRMVFDGIIPHVAGSRKTFVNHRWAQPGRFSQQHSAHLTPGDQRPFTYRVMTDALTGKRDGIMARCQQSNNCPTMFRPMPRDEILSQGRRLCTVETLQPRSLAWRDFEGVSIPVRTTRAKTEARKSPCCKECQGARLYVSDLYLAQAWSL